MLTVGCLTVVFYCLSTITNSILQGIDRMRIPVFHSAISLAVNAALLTGMLFIFNMDVFAWIIADMIFALLMCILNALSLRKYLGYRQEIPNTFVKPAAAALAMGIIAYFVHMGIHSVLKRSFDVVITIIIAVIVYFLLLFIMKVIKEEQILALPGGRKLAAVFRKLKLI